jgi:hypothetical protein
MQFIIILFINNLIYYNNSLFDFLYCKIFIQIYYNKAIFFAHKSSNQVIFFRFLFNNNLLLTQKTCNNLKIYLQKKNTYQISYSILRVFHNDSFDINIFNNIMQGR